MHWPSTTVRCRLTDEEEAFTRGEETKGEIQRWAALDFERNSSTRFEIGATMLAMLPPEAVNIGTDSQGTLLKGNAIIEHLQKREIFEKKNLLFNKTKTDKK